MLPDSNQFKKNQLLIIAAFTIGLIVFVFFFLVPAFRGEVIVKADYYLGSIRIHLYSWLLFAAATAGLLWARRSAAKAGLSVSEVENLVVLNIFAGLVGARLHHAFSAWDYYVQNPLAAFQIWRGGLGIYGGIVAGVLATLIYTRAKKMSFFTIADLLAPALILGQAVGRWGNFFNQEAYGVPTELAWKMFVQPAFRPPQYLNSEFFHPVFLYESLWAVTIFFVLRQFFLKKYGETKVRRSGYIFAFYLMLYPLGRFFIEGLRADATFVDGLLLNQVISLILVAVGLIIFARRATE